MKLNEFLTEIQIQPEAAEKIGTVISTHVIPRPAEDVTQMITPNPDPQPIISEQLEDNHDETAEAEQPEDSSVFILFLPYGGGSL